MASKTIAIILLFNIVLFTTANAACSINIFPLFSACRKELDGLVSGRPVGSPKSSFCCIGIDQIGTTEATTCLCSAFQMDHSIGNISEALGKVFKFCGRPSDIQCVKP
ncbi:unnamed protein product [Eruca vesicaria subsp. sativa]|uniref:Hydrophobic seed protein domain-containing protein n=1 Tax=Eruca vesicaria subsp. sativa TaxID=29727 RepID=A0ABC8KZQ3_ERUVS|nr:unnamed protein product [Eruca vesicaria subsp. sativa]